MATPATNYELKYDPVVRAAATANGIPYESFKAQLRQESGFNPMAVSHAGARGVGQFMPKTGAAYGLLTDADFFDPIKSINASAKMMKDLVGTYGDWNTALVAYNGGTKAAKAFKAGNLNGVPAETRDYVNKLGSNTPFKAPLLDNSTVQLPSVTAPSAFEVGGGSRFHFNSESVIPALMEQSQSPDTVGFLGGIEHGAIGSTLRKWGADSDPFNMEEDVQLDKKQRDDLLAKVNYDENAYDFVVSGLKDVKDIDNRLKVLQENLDYAAQEADSGLLDSIMSGVGDAATDPVNWVAGLATGGMGFVGRVAIGGALANAISGQVRQKYTGVETNVLMDMASGAVFGAAFEGAAKALGKGANFLGDTARRANIIRDSIRQGVTPDPKIMEGFGGSKSLAARINGLRDWMEAKFPDMTTGGVLFGSKSESIRNIAKKIYSWERGNVETLPDGTKVSRERYGKQNASEIKEERDKEAFKYLNTYQDLYTRLLAKGYTEETLEKSIQNASRGKKIKGDLGTDKDFSDLINTTDEFVSGFIGDELVSRGILTRKLDNYGLPVSPNEGKVADLIEKLGGGAKGRELAIQTISDLLKNGAKGAKTRSKLKSFWQNEKPKVVEEIKEKIRQEYQAELDQLNKERGAGTQDIETEPRPKVPIDIETDPNAPVQRRHGSKLVSKHKSNDLLKKFMADDSLDNVTRTMASKLLGTTDFSVHYMTENHFDSFVLGYYSLRDRQIYLRQGVHPDVALHEITHAKTALIMENYYNPSLLDNPKHPSIAAIDPNAPDHIKHAMGDLIDMFNTLRRKQGRAADNVYGLSTLHEFVAESMTPSSSLTKLLKETKWRNLKSMWGKFVEAIAKMLGVSKDTAYAHSLDAIDKIISTPTHGGHAPVSTTTIRGEIPKIPFDDAEFTARSNKAIEDEFNGWVKSQANNDAVGYIDQGRSTDGTLFHDHRTGGMKYDHSRTPWDLSYEGANGISMTGLMDNVFDTLNRYHKRTTGDIAFNEVMGTKNMREVDDIITKSVTDRKFEDPKRAQVEERALQQAVKQIYGMSPKADGKGFGVSDAIADVLRNMAFMTKNGYMGLMNMFETAEGVKAYGASYAIRSIPMADKMMGNWSKGAMTNEEARAVHNMVFGDEIRQLDLWRDITRTNISKYQGNKFLAGIVSGTQWAAQHSPMTKFLQATQSSIVNEAQGQFLAEMARAAHGLRKTKRGFFNDVDLKRNSIDNLRAKEMLEAVRRATQVNPDGSIKMTAPDEIMGNPEVLADLRRMGDYVANNVIQRDSLSDAFTWADGRNPILDLLLQFKTFALRSYNKRMAKMMNRVEDEGAASQAYSLMISGALSTIGFAGITTLRAQGLPDEEREKFYERNIGVKSWHEATPESLATLAFNGGVLRNGVLAAPVLGLNSIGLANPVGKTTFEPYYGSQTDVTSPFKAGEWVSNMFPSLGIAGGAVNLGINSWDLMRYQLGAAEYTDKERERIGNNFFRNMKQITPNMPLIQNYALEWARGSDN